MVRRKKRIADSVIEKIEKQYLNPDVEEVEKLPSERELAKAFGVSRNSVREALQTLALQGIIEIRQGGGSYIKQSEGSTLQQTLSEQIETIKSYEVFEMLEVRRALEVESAGLAALRARAEDMEQIRQALEEMATSAENSEAGIEADLNFHLRIVKASHNSILIQLTKTLIGQLKETIRTTREHRFSTPGNYEETFHEHKEIYLAIASGDSEVAKELMEMHISRVRSELSESALPELKL